MLVCNNLQYNTYSPLKWGHPANQDTLIGPKDVCTGGAQHESVQPAYYTIVHTSLIPMTAWEWDWEESDVCPMDTLVDTCTTCHSFAQERELSIALHDTGYVNVGPLVHLHEFLDSECYLDEF